MKIIALYLPQYHEVEENNQWWGKGYTEWTAVKTAKKLHPRHNQPKTPLNNNYYDLSEESAETWKWQADLLKEYNIYGFAIYHYWFNGKMLLEKPMEVLLKNKTIDLKYCVTWANETWTRTWYGKETEILMKQDYGDSEDWIKHYKYLSNFFKDSRYIKINNKPVINIYRTYDIQNFDLMIKCWNQLAISDGFDGVYIVSGKTHQGFDKRVELFDAYYNFEPGYSLKQNVSLLSKKIYELNIFKNELTNKIFKKEQVTRIVNIKTIYKNILKEATKKHVKKTYFGMYPSWDNTPRRGSKGIIHVNSSPDLFEKYISKLNMIIDKNDYIYINAWNEWGEGCYLEPDTDNRYSYLEILKKYSSLDVEK